MRGSLLWSNDRDIMNLWMLQLRHEYPCKKMEPGSFTQIRLHFSLFIIAVFCRHSLCLLFDPSFQEFSNRHCF